MLPWTPDAAASTVACTKVSTASTSTTRLRRTKAQTHRKCHSRPVCVDRMEGQCRHSVRAPASGVNPLVHASLHLSCQWDGRLDNQILQLQSPHRVLLGLSQILSQRNGEIRKVASRVSEEVSRGRTASRLPCEAAFSPTTLICLMARDVLMMVSAIPLLCLVGQRLIMKQSTRRHITIPCSTEPSQICRARTSQRGKWVTIVAPRNYALATNLPSGNGEVR